MLPRKRGSALVFMRSIITNSMSPRPQKLPSSIQAALVIATTGLVAQEPEGYPDRSPNLDAQPGFKYPPAGYGEVPFWWWSGEDLDEDRLLWQLRQLHEKGISGVQVNYSHLDTPGWLTDTKEPALFTPEWWKIYSRISEECSTLGMGIGLSTYTIDWPNGAKNLFHDLFYSHEELNAIELTRGSVQRIEQGETMTIACVDNAFAVRAYPVVQDTLQVGGIDLTPTLAEDKVTWTAPKGIWEVWSFGTTRQEGSLNPLQEGIGQRVAKGFFQKFEDNNPGNTSEGLNFFFNDELEIGHGKFAWNPDFLEEFQSRKGYDLLDVLPAMWVEVGDKTPKVRIDYADVRMALMEERYFEPIFNWHASRGIIFGCDNHGRGLDPHAYGDYFRACRWYTAPGHDTPGGSADPIKGKVSASIAKLYQRPRVWLEGYHSLGWGAAPEKLMFATRENYLYGCTLLNLHGLYYTTLGSHWEWAPPCYHFRMPYWEHMGVFLKYFERLSYVMSQGRSVADVAVIYPVTPYEAEMTGDSAKDTAFEMGKKLIEAGIDFDFIDHQSLSRAEIKDGHLVIPDCDAHYKALVFPNMKAARWDSVVKAAEFNKSGGTVLSIGAPPTASDRAGRNDPELVAMDDAAFTDSHRASDTMSAVELIREAFAPDVKGLNRVVRGHHRKIGPRDLYLVMDAEPGDIVEFRAKGAVELWDPWTGDTQPLQITASTSTHTSVVLPLESYEAQIVVFSSDRPHQNPAPSSESLPKQHPISPDDWQVTFLPTMDNRFGDFRLPVSPANEVIGVEARRFAWTSENDALAGKAMDPTTDDQSWDRQLHGYGPKFFLLGPLPESTAPEALDTQLAQLDNVDPSVPVVVDGAEYHWKPYEFSWRYGKFDDPGHQGYHGLKGSISKHFIRLGKNNNPGNGAAKLMPEEHQRYYLWSSASVAQPTTVDIHTSEASPATMPNTSPVVAPAAVIINGNPVSDLKAPIELTAGSNPLLIRYDHWGQSHLVLRRHDAALPDHHEPLSMKWYKDPAVIPFDLRVEGPRAEWYRFVSPPGTRSIVVNAQTSQPIQVWMDGDKMTDKGQGKFEASTPRSTSSIIALRLTPEVGFSGGSAIPEPITVETDGSGLMSLGDWSKVGILNNYSGGIRYTKTFSLPEAATTGTAEIDLGQVVATAEVKLNGTKVGIRVAPPWKLDVTGHLKSGDNQLEVTVYNTLSNHYQTIPSLYRGDPISGLLGPVSILQRDDR